MFEVLSKMTIKQILNFIYMFVLLIVYQSCMDSFCLLHQNTLNHEELAHLQDKDNGGAYRAVAAMVHGEHISFYECGFVSVQDTLWDKEGHHLFKSCYIEGHVDFIFGDGTSVYEVRIKLYENHSQ